MFLQNFKTELIMRDEGGIVQVWYSVLVHQVKEYIRKLAAQKE